jgi:hypothetical protein
MKGVFMNIKLEIDASDIFAESESKCENGCGNSQSLTDVVKEEIVYRIKDIILKQISEDAKKEIQKQVIEQVELAMKFQISGVIASVLQEIKIKSHNESKMLSVKEFVEERTNYYVDDRSITQYIKTCADNYSKSTKERYDVLFATTLLQKMRQAGLLKDDRIEELLLIEPK